MYKFKRPNVRVFSWTFFVFLMNTGLSSALAQGLMMDLPSQSLKNKKSSALTGSFEYISNEFVDNVGEVPGNRHLGELTLDYNTKKESVEKRFDAVARVNSEQQLQYSIKEAFVDYKIGKSSDLVIGRKVLDWSNIDATWGLGKMNNRVNMDYFTPGQEGLTGALFNVQFDSGFKLAAFGSFVYVPEMNPGMTINKSKGSVVCENPWCNAPSRTVPVEGKDVPVFYDINYPEISDVVMRMSGGLQAGFNTKHFSVDTFYMRKPENQITTSAEVRYETDKSRVYAEVTPQFYYHDVSGGKIAYNNAGLSVYGSTIYINPSEYPDGDQPYIQYMGIIPEKRKEQYVGGGSSYASKRVTISADYLARVSEYNKKDDILAELPRWNQAMHLGVSAALTSKLSIMADYKFDMLTEDRLSMFSASYRPSANIVTSIGAKVIADSKEESYWTKFSNNDMFYGSLKYFF